MRIAIIPARGGSKRIPRKNIKLFYGSPIIAYSIKVALESNLFDEVFVSTDDSEIAEIAQKHGAIVPTLRSNKNSDDYATTADVLLEVLAYYQGQNKQVGSFCCIYPTAPLIEVKDLQVAYQTFEAEQYDVLLSAVKFSFPVQRGFHLDAQNGVQLLNPELINTRSQDLEAVFHDAGAFYFLNTLNFINSKSIWGGKVGAYMLDETKVQDIDNETDWQLAELKYKLNKGNE